MPGAFELVFFLAHGLAAVAAGYVGARRWRWRGAFVAAAFGVAAWTVLWIALSLWQALDPAPDALSFRFASWTGMGMIAAAPSAVWLVLVAFGGAYGFAVRAVTRWNGPSPEV